MTTLTISGYVEVDASLFDAGVLEDALREFLTGGDPRVTFGRDPDAVLGRVTRIGGRGEKLTITAELPEPPVHTVLKDAWNKIRSGSIKSLGVEGKFAPEAATIYAVTVAPLSPVPGTGYIESVVTGQEN